MANRELSHQQVAEAGEHYVLYKLYTLGFIGGQAPRGMPETDLVVMTPRGEHVAAVQVKTRLVEPRDGGWHMRRKHEDIVRTNLFYVFVSLDGPSCWVVPSATVAEVIRTAHAAWLRTPGRGGTAHNDHDMRRLCSDYQLPMPERFDPGWLAEYSEAWGLLKRSLPGEA